MKISELKPEIIGKRCRIANNPEIYIIMDYVKNIHDKNNVKLYNPVTQEISWVPFNLIILEKGEANESNSENCEGN